MRKTMLVLFALILIAIAIEAWRIRAGTTAADSSQTCTDQYNALVKQAKENLLRGDRIAAANSLIEARAKLRGCQSRSPQDVRGFWFN